jgi:cell division septation protein DedD
MSENRTLFEVLRALHEQRAEGELVVRDRSGAVHRVVLRSGRPVAARVRGRFDPLLARLRDLGALDEHTHRQALGQLAHTERRAGEVARSLGAEPRQIERALSAQLRAALDALARRVDGTAATYAFEARRVAAAEIASWTALPSFASTPSSTATSSSTSSASSRATKSAPRPPRPSPASRVPEGLDRATFRRLARALHPDRAHGLSDRERAENERALAELTARWHGLG